LECGELCEDFGEEVGEEIFTTEGTESTEKRREEKRREEKRREEKRREEKRREEKRGPSAAWPGALETARRKKPGHFGRDDRHGEERPKVARGRESQDGGVKPPVQLVLGGEF
jgi:hypothetical protein